MNAAELKDKLLHGDIVRSKLIEKALILRVKQSTCSFKSTARQ
jgi:hypothetical protein